MGAEYTSLKSDIVADTATQINAIKGSYTTLRNHQIAQYSIGKVDVKPVFNGSNPKELAAFLADGNDSKEIEYTTDDIFTEYELYRALSRRTIDQIKTSFKEVTGKDFNPSDEGQAKNLRKEFLRVLFYKANMFRTLEPILEGKLPKYITELQKEVKKETEKNVMNAQEIASNPDFKIIMQKLESTL
jgi:hypothetical protein